MIKKYFDDAILLEEKGYKFYTELAQETSNELSKKLFLSLAEQEKYHIEQINSYLTKAETVEIKFDSIENTIHELFNSLGKEMIGKDLSQATGLEKAMQMEKEGYALYQEAHDSTDNADDRLFLDKLIKMEKEHYESLANLHFYYTNNEQWLAEEESKTWNWMNF